MSRLKLTVVPETFRVGSLPQSSFTGDIFFDYDGIYYPSKDWNDLVCSMIAMWLWNFELILKKKQDKFELHFMDGPYIIYGHYSDGEAKLRFTRGKDVVHEAVVKMKSLIQDVCEIAHSVLIFADTVKLDNTGVKQVRRLLHEVELLNG